MCVILWLTTPDSIRIHPCDGTVLVGVLFLFGRIQKMGRRLVEVSMHENKDKEDYQRTGCTTAVA